MNELKLYDDCKKMLGTYKCVYQVYEPRTLHLVAIDKCLLPEIATLWNLGIDTIESCCGHNRQAGYIMVYPEYIEKMEQLGYVRDSRTETEGTFLCKTQNKNYSCTFEDSGYKPCELQAIDCENCEYYDTEDN